MTIILRSVVRSGFGVRIVTCILTFCIHIEKNLVKGHQQSIFFDMEVLSIL